MKLTGENRSTRGKTCSSATLSTTNPAWTDPGSNPGLRGERPATNRLSLGTARGPTVTPTLVYKQPYGNILLSGVQTFSKNLGASPNSRRQKVVMNQVAY
jgi:hypothetical protein